MDRYLGQWLDNRYEILDCIGSGGMAVVFKAYDHRLNRLVAVKILKDEFMEDEDFLRHFHAESQAVAMLNHPNIVAIFDVSSQMDRDFIVMELLEGMTLKEYMAQSGKLPWRVALHFAIEIAMALEHAHGRRLVHRDIKPQNIMVSVKGSVKVMDFGIARMMENNSTMTREAIGSVHYISPEQATGGQVDERSDLYSLGVVMYEMVTSQMPFDGDAPVAVALAHLNNVARRPSELEPDIPKGLEQIIMRAMARQPSDRYPSARAMLADMNALRLNPEKEFPYEQPLTLPRYHPEPEKQNPVPRKTDRRVVSRLEPPEEETELPKSKASTVAVLLCSLAAIVAIIIFMILLTRKDLVTEQRPTETRLSQIPSTQKHPTKAPDIPQYTVVHTEASTKPAVPTTKPQMPNLVNLSQAEARQILERLGVTDVQWVYQDSRLPAGTVIGQTLAPGCSIDGSGTIYLICAGGSVTKRCTFEMPFRMEDFLLTVMLDGRPVVLEQPMEAFCSTATFDLTGKGVQSCQLYIDGQLYLTVKVDFDAE